MYSYPTLTASFDAQLSRIHQTLNARRIDCPEVIPAKVKPVRVEAQIVYPTRRDPRGLSARVLTADQIADMQRLRHLGVSVRAIAGRFQVSRGHIERATTRARCGCGRPTAYRQERCAHCQGLKRSMARRPYASRAKGATHVEA